VRKRRRPLPGRAIDREVKEILEQAHQQALEMLRHNRDLLETIAQEILETEVIEGEKLHHWLNQVQAPPSLTHTPTPVPA